jgi:hypothetical protein
MADESYQQTDAEESARVEAHCKALAEHFDSVTILCSRHEGSRGTRTIAKGAGNWHTQFGIVREWLINHEEDIREAARRDWTP